jgi:hypothetical protein
MSTPELEQAVAASRWRGVERDFTEVIARMFDVDPAVVARIVYVWETLSDKRLIHSTESEMQDLVGELKHGGDIPDDLRSAIEHTAARAFKRIAIRWRMEREMFLEVPFEKLVPASNPSRMCDGCVWQFECVRDSLSTPKDCLKSKLVYCKDQPDPRKPTARKFQHQYASVTPLKLEDAVVRVSAEHPRGTYTVNIMDVRI